MVVTMVLCVVTWFNVSVLKLKSWSYVLIKRRPQYASTKLRAAKTDAKGIIKGIVKEEKSEQS